MHKTKDVEKVKGRGRDGVEEGELKAEMGQYVFLLYFYFKKASLRSLFPEHGGICLCVHARVQVCTLPMHTC